MPWIMNFYHFRNHSLGKGEETGVTEVTGPSISYYVLYFEKAIEGFVLHQNCSL